MSGLDAASWQFANTSEDRFQYQFILIQKYDTHKSTINKRRLEWRTWRRFYINQINQLKQTSLNNQAEPSPRPSTNLRGKQIRMSGLYTAHRQFYNAPEEKYQYQWTLTWSMRTSMSKINDTNMITELQKDTWLTINSRNNNNLYRFDYGSSVQENSE